ncbi:histidine phosphatase family protein [Patescibacteria group bacterium]
MHDLTLLPHETIDEKVIYYKKYFENQGKNYSEDKLKEAIEYLSYRHADPLPKTESDTKPTMYIFRHGQTDDNANFVFSGWREARLTKIGEQQALDLAPLLKDKKVQMLISSPQVRAMDTMKLAISMNIGVKDLNIQPDNRIMERSYGDYQGQSKIEVAMKNPKGLEKIRRSFRSKPPNGESIEMVCMRVGEFCDEIVPLMKSTKVNVAVSCHGNSIRGFRRYFEKLSDHDTAHVETPLGQDYLAYVIE